MEDLWKQIVKDVLQPGAVFTSLVECSVYAIAYDLVKYMAKKMWYAYIARKKQQINRIYPYNVGQKCQNISIFDDETEGIKAVLEDSWPEAMSKIFEQSSEDILKYLNSFDNLDSFYATSRKIMAKNRRKEISIFRHNSFNIIKEDYLYIVRSLKRKNKVKIFISGISKNLEDSTWTELNFLFDNPLAQKLLLQMGHFNYSRDFELNLLLSQVDSLLSLMLLLDIMKKRHKNLTIFLNNSLPSVRGQVTEGGETFFIRLPKQAPEHLGVGCSSEWDELRDKVILEINRRKPMDVSDEDVLAEIIRNKAYKIQDFINKNGELHTGWKGKDELKSVLDSCRLSGSQFQVDQDALEKVHDKICDFVLKNKRKTFEMHKLWEEYERIRNVYTGDFDTFLNEESRFLVKKYKIRGSEIYFLHRK
ncbi:MAG: hypothetical protein AYK18_15920 [Theionarchaea archaeon DG-70]|nr:MAG: hypothetical protein AYK18_15920 [Theionarchaea archaeon DG-70]